MTAQEDDSEKSFDPTPEKLRKAREKGEVARSADLSVAAGYAGLLLALMALGKPVLAKLSTVFVVMIDQSDTLSRDLVTGQARDPFAAMIWQTGLYVFPIFLVPAILVLTSVTAQRALIFTPSKLKPKLSRISLISNAKNKFGRSGLFEFAKSSAKLVLFSACLALFLQANLTEIIAASSVNAWASIALMMQLMLRFLAFVTVLVLTVGAIDYLWQWFEHIRKNRMSRKEIQDEMKDAEGDPHVKQQRRQRGQELAMNQMMVDVLTADVVIVNPTHFAVALKWSRAPGSAPVCVAKGVDEIAATIREVAIGAGVPIHSDPPTARALHATIEIGEEIAEEHYKPVAAAIRFAEAMRKRAKGKVG